ncbi:hypothetical protein O181_069447 [Austropuccinia psidii MF-1]|uniref:Uncharacterized protein n=1 Tax=Austropuccinia psidii MF-1 TaxID=1389203 RepID=A0A9Q3F1C0_9BASI|nr:hypothetical protein [Austropuccinia psidii MF-1]
MPVQHSPPANNTRSQRNPAVLTATATVPLDHTPSVHQLSANLDRVHQWKEQHPPEEGELNQGDKDLSLASWVVILECLKVQVGFLPW